MAVRPITTDNWPIRTTVNVLNSRLKIARVSVGLMML